MTRPIVLSNGELHVGVNNFGLVHDFYYPYVGLENHCAGQSMRHRVGVWLEGSILWLDEEGWDFSFVYPHDALVGHTIATHKKIGIRIEFDDAVDSEQSVFMRNLHVINLREDAREVRVFLHQAFAIGDSRSNTDTAQYLPDAHAILHYRGRRAFVVAARTSGEWFDQHSIGLFGIEGHEGTYRDADDGELSMSNVEHGRVDSVVRVTLNLDPHGSERVHYWVACGTSTREALYIHKKVIRQGIDIRLDVTVQSWHKWLAPAHRVSLRMPSAYRQRFIQSLMIMRSQIDRRGAIIASTDTAMLNYSRDTYAYCWPRDGANVIWPLIRLGYKEEPYRFFAFCKRVLNPNGYLMHKFRADGALGSSWHPYYHDDGTVTPPIQEDETALVLFVFAQFYYEHHDRAMLTEFYTSMVEPMANFLAEFVDRHSGLPRSSYDLWEERFATFTYTTAVTFAALQAAAGLAEVMGQEKHAVMWRAAADDIRTHAHKLLYNENRQMFYKSIKSTRGGEREFDATMDMSSFYGAFMFGLFPLDDERVAAAAHTLSSHFGLDARGAQGIPRYENDIYRRTEGSNTSNYWPITTLWMAQYYLELGRDADAMPLIDWVISKCRDSGVLSEQIDPSTGSQVSVAPLTWSHAELVSTLLDLTSEADASV